MRLYLLPLLFLLSRLLPSKKQPLKSNLIAENLLLKQQLLILNRHRKRPPKLETFDRCILGCLAHWLSPKRLDKSAIIIRPSTILTFHKALVTKKYQRLFGQTIHAKPGPKGPASGGK